MKKLLGYAFFGIFLAAMANAVTINLPYTFAPGQKIVSSEVNDNFTTITDAINNGELSSENILDGGIATQDLATSSVTTVKIATGNVTQITADPYSGFYTSERRRGCLLRFNSVSQIEVTTPCELSINGLRVATAATATVVLPTNLMDDTLTANRVYYVYGYFYGSSNQYVHFEARKATPDVTTWKLFSDSSRRYIGSFRTRSDTTDIVRFVSNGPLYHGTSLTSGNALQLQEIAVPSGAALFPVNVPVFAKMFTYSIGATVVGGGQCVTRVRSNIDSAGTITMENNTYQKIDTAITGAYTGNSQWAPMDYFGRSTFDYSGSNCSAVNISITGWEEPASAYQ